MLDRSKSSSIDVTVSRIDNLTDAIARFANQMTKISSSEGGGAATELMNSISLFMRRVSADLGKFTSDDIRGNLALVKQSIQGVVGLFDPKTGIQGLYEFDTQKFSDVLYEIQSASTAMAKPKNMKADWLGNAFYAIGEGMKNLDPEKLKSINDTFKSISEMMSQEGLRSDGLASVVTALTEIRRLTSAKEGGAADPETRVSAMLKQLEAVRKVFIETEKETTAKMAATDSENLAKSLEKAQASQQKVKETVDAVNVAVEAQVTPIQGVIAVAKEYLTAWLAIKKTVIEVSQLMSEQRLKYVSHIEAPEPQTKKGTKPRAARPETLKKLDETTKAYGELAIA